MKRKIVLAAIMLIVTMGTSTSAKDKLTVDNCDMLKSVMSVYDATDEVIIQFAEQYEDERIEIDGYISLIETDEDGEYDIYVRAGRDGETYTGARFKLEVEPEDIFETSTLPEYVNEGNKIHIIGDVDSYNSEIGGGIDLDVRKIKEVKEEHEESTTASSGDIRPEVKDALDSYEAYFDEYVEVMNAYAEDPTNLSIMGKYMEFLGSYAEMTKKMDDLEGDLTDAELGYYLEVTGRITQKLATVEY